jgi:hypothetical protein
MLLSSAIAECQHVAKGGYRPPYVQMSSPMSLDPATGACLVIVIVLILSAFLSLCTVVMIFPFRVLSQCTAPILRATWLQRGALAKSL